MFRFTNLIIFELTRDCNIRCKYCYVQDKDCYKGEIIDFEVYKKIINQIVKQRLSCNKQEEKLQMNFHGGEFTMIGKKRFISICEYTVKTFTENGINYSLGMQSNGTLLDEEWLDIFKRFDIPLGMSLDSLIEKENLRFSSDEQLHKLKDLLTLAGEKNMIASTLSVFNKHNLKNIKKDDKIFFNELPVVSRKINIMEDMVNPYNSKLQPKGKEVFKYLHKKELELFLKTGKTKEAHTRTLLDDTLTDILSFHENGYYSGCTGKMCGAGLTMIAVRPDGSMGYCDRYSRDLQENYIENALDYDFLGLHQLQKVMEFNLRRHNILKENGCDTCRAQYICEGGCMASFYSKFGYYGIEKDFTCPQFLNFFDYVKKNLIPILKKYIETNRVINIENTVTIFNLKNDMLDYLNSKGIGLELKDNKIKPYYKE